MRLTPDKESRPILRPSQSFKRYGSREPEPADPREARNALALIPYAFLNAREKTAGLLKPWAAAMLATDR